MQRPAYGTLNEQPQGHPSVEKDPPIQKTTEPLSTFLFISVSELPMIHTSEQPSLIVCKILCCKTGRFIV